MYTDNTTYGWRTYDVNKIQTRMQRDGQEKKTRVPHTYTRVGLLVAPSIVFKSNTTTLKLELVKMGLG